MISRLIKYLRLNFPELYFGLINIFEKLHFRKKTIRIFDNCGGSFKTYIADNKMPAVLNTLTANLDEYSIKTIDVLFHRLLNYPDARYGIQIETDDSKTIGGLLDEELPQTRKEVKSKLNKIRREIRFPRHLMDPSVFYFDHGLTYLPTEIKDYISDADFMDLGAYFGDSALSFKKYNFRKIFSVEFSKKAIENYKMWLRLNRIPEDKYQIIESAMSSSDDNPPIYLTGNDYTLYSDLRVEDQNSALKVEQRSLDSIVEEYKIEPKLIKADIEGYALECMKGATKTLQSYRPVLTLAIYHNPYEFFETKPYLESILDNYTYMIRKMSVTPYGLRCHAETLLLAYPNELINS